MENVTKRALKKSHHKSATNETMCTTNISLFRFRCHVCKLEFKTWCALGNHTTRDHEEKPMVWCLCNKFLYTKAAINRHIAKHDAGSKSFISCHRCGKVYLSQKHLQAHILSHDTDHTDKQTGHKCDECGRYFAYASILKVHKRTHLPENMKYSSMCSICGKRYSTNGALKIHTEAVHDKLKPYVCNVCGTDFANKANMENHINSHEEMLAYICVKCPKRFKTKKKLLRHFNTHKDQGYSCPECRKVLKTRITLRAHIRNNHASLASFVCDICCKKYYKKHSIEVHLRSHDKK